MLSASQAYFNFIVSPDFYLGPVRLHWYGIFMAAAILAGFILAYRWIGPRFGVAPKLIEDLLPYLAIGGFLGARLYFVAFSWEYFGRHGGEVLAFWRGGLSIYGAIIGGALTIAIYAKIKRVPLLALLDVAAVAAPLGQAIGRFGNFFNYEAFGRPTDLAWRMYVPPQFRPAEFLERQYFHPAFLYEALWDFAIFGALIYLIRTGKNRGAGYLAGSYLILYSLGRFWIESVRLDSFFIGTMRVDQMVALAAMLAGAVIIQYAYADQKNN